MKEKGEGGRKGQTSGKYQYKHLQVLNVHRNPRTSNIKFRCYFQSREVICHFRVNYHPFPYKCGPSGSIRGHLLIPPTHTPGIKQKGSPTMGIFCGRSPPMEFLVSQGKDGSHSHDLLEACKNPGFPESIWRVTLEPKAYIHLLCIYYVYCCNFNH